MMNVEPTSLMFVAGAKPLAGARVRLRAEPSHEWTTDAEGRVKLSIARGVHQFEVSVAGDEWLPHQVDTSGRSSLLVVHVKGKSTPATVARTTAGGFLASQIEAMGERYVFERVLGRGGMGVVIKAQDTVLERSVAMKALSEELRDNAEAQRVFLAEARALATLRHPNLVAVHDVTTIDGIALMVFEFVDGENLEARTSKGSRLSDRELVDVARQLAAALDYLHQRGVIHRDLKPANLILKPDGELKVIDFGLARSLEDIYTKGTRVRGTPAYMSPEQIQGHELSHASDLYQFGITLYELATGELPFPAGDMGYAHVHMTPPPVSERAPRLHPDLAALIDRCLEKSPADRPAAASDISALLEHIEWALRAPDPLTSEQLARVTGTQSALGDTHAARLSDAYPVTPPRRSRAPALIALALFLGVGAAALFSGAFGDGVDVETNTQTSALSLAASTTAAAVPVKLESAAPEPAAPEPAAPEAIAPEPVEDDPIVPDAVEPEPAAIVPAKQPARAPTPRVKKAPKPKAATAPEPTPEPPAEPEPASTPEPEPVEVEPVKLEPVKLEPVEVAPVKVVAEKPPEEKKPAEKKPAEKKPEKKVIPRSF